MAVAVTVIAPAVAPLHVATPLVWSFALLMLTLTGSETDQVAKPKGKGGGTHPWGNTGLAMNCCWFPGAAALWFAEPLAGEIDIPVMLQSWLLEPPQPAAAKLRSRAPKIRVIFMETFSRRRIVTLRPAVQQDLRVLDNMRDRSQSRRIRLWIGFCFSELKAKC